MIPSVEEVLARLVAWGNARPEVCAMLLSSSLTRPDGPVDLLTDYDLILVVTDADTFAREDNWISDYGPPMVRWGDKGEQYGLTTYFHGVVYEDYTKIDYSVWPLEMLEKITNAPTLSEELDAGYHILLDKDGRTTGWKPPSYRGYIPIKPTATEFQALMEEFWWSTTYVAKSLWRDELTIARFCQDYDIKIGVLRKLFEWHIEIENDWSVRPGVLGRGLKKRMPADLWEQFANTYVGPKIEDNWAALDDTIVLFRRIAKEVAVAFGYPYPQQVDDKVSAYLDMIRKLPAPVPLPGPKATKT